MTEAVTAGGALASARTRFSSLQSGFVFMDSPGGSQVPDEVGEAVATVMREACANVGHCYGTSLRVGAILEEAETKAARFLGCDPHEITFGQSMTTLNFALSRTAGRDFKPGDEVIVSSLDHDAGIAPWRELAADKDLVLKKVELLPDTRYDFDDLRSKLSDRTRVVAFAWASNAVGTITDAAKVCRLAHSVGALAWIDAVHYAAHEQVDVRAVDADVLLCSPYKFCGPHLGLAYAREAISSRWRPYKVVPAPMNPVGRRFATGTPSFELLAGFTAAIDYLDSIGGFDAITPYERTLGERFLASIPDPVTLYGLPSMKGRVPTFLVNVAGVPAADVEATLANRDIGVWAGTDYYSPELYKRLGYENKAVRIGLIHYNSVSEVDRLVEALRDCAS